MGCGTGIIFGMDKLPVPPQEAIIYEDDKLYICLATYPITKGHTIVVWKNKAEDLHLLRRKDYEYLMDMVDIARDSLLETLKIKKVYLIYMDEVKQVHCDLDLHLLRRKDYEYLMDMVDIARDSLLETLKIKKVYLIYMDEVKQVHWHLIPRYDERGFNILMHEPKENKDFSLTFELSRTFINKKQKLQF